MGFRGDVFNCYDLEEFLNNQIFNSNFPPLKPLEWREQSTWTGPASLDSSITPMLYIADPSNDRRLIRWVFQSPCREDEQWEWRIRAKKSPNNEMNTY